MGFITSKGSSQLTRALPRIKSSSRKSFPSNQLKDISRGQCKNYVFDLAPRRKSDAAVYETEDIDLDRQLKLAEEMCKGNDCMWLSSDFDSLSLLVSDQSGDIWELNSSNTTPKKKLDGIESLYGSSDSSASDDARVRYVDANPEFLKAGCSLKKPPVYCFDGCASSHDRSIMEDSSAHGSSCSTLDDSACSIWENDRTSMWISSLDFNLEGSRLVQKKDDEVSVSYSDHSSPCSSSVNSLSRNKYMLSESDGCSCFSPQKDGRMSVSKEANALKSVEVKLMKTNSIPASRRFLQRPGSNQAPKKSASDESYSCFSLQKDGMMRGGKEISALKSVKVKLNKTSSIPASRKVLKTPESSQTPKKSATVSKKSVFPGKNTQNSTPSPSQSNRSSPRVSNRLVRCNSSIKDGNSFSKKETHQLKHENQMQKQEELPDKHLIYFEAKHFQESLVEGVTIERMIGLDEFDGHEGINAGLGEEFPFTL